jgi:four helix bundle protein
VAAKEVESELSHKYTDLIVWQKARAFASEIYRVSEQFPKAEIFGLTAQIRRASISVPSNIAEGQGRLTKGEFCPFLGLARGSLLEVETQLAIAVDLHFLQEEEFQKLRGYSSEILRLLNGLIDSMRLRKTVGG